MPELKLNTQQVALYIVESGAKKETIAPALFAWKAIRLMHKV
jgi:hypothetical protein